MYGYLMNLFDPAVSIQQRLVPKVALWKRFLGQGRHDD